MTGVVGFDNWKTTNQLHKAVLDSSGNIIQNIINTTLM